MSYRGGGYRDRDRGDPRAKVYVGDLPPDVDKKDLEDVFIHYGDLRSVWVARNPPGFAFIEFKDSRDAEDAVHKLDGRDICGAAVKVEIASGRRRGGGGGGYGGGGYGRGPPRDRSRETCYACNERGHFARDCKYGRRPGDGQRRSYGGSSYGSRRRRVFDFG